MDLYHVLEMVGEGSFGRVYKGRKKFTGQVVALKFMPKVGRSDKELRSLKKEIEIMRGLKHPNIVQLLDSFETEAEVVVVTEYAEGQLFQILEDDGNLPEYQVREIACQLVSALYYLHSHRILHRDMKPQNILLGKSGVVKLCDFGFARAMSVSTLVLTSIKGTPLYMSPELVEEKPYDHTADLWSLGCILYELHTGAPPFYTNSIFHLVQLIVRDQVKWPDSMSDTCKSFLKGLLTKDPQKRLSWPDLLHHPYVADRVTVLSDTSVSPLTVTPSPDMVALKLQQVAAKTVPTSGGSKLLRKAREQCNKVKQKIDNGVGNEKASHAMSEASSRSKPPSSDFPVTSVHSVIEADSQILVPKIQACVRTKHRGQISRDYEQEFPSVEVGPRLIRKCSEDSQATLCKQNVNSEEYWEKLAQESDPSKQQQKELLKNSVIIHQLKAKILALKAQLIGGIVIEAWQIHLPLKILSNLIVSSDPEKSTRISQELGLPHVLFDVIQEAVENSEFIKQPWIVPALEEIVVVLLKYWEKHCDWVEEEERLQEFAKPFNTILSHPDLITLAPLAASVLSLFVQHIDFELDLDNLISLLKYLLFDSYECQCCLPPGWGRCDGFLSLLLYTLSEENGFRLTCLDPLLLELWKKIGTSLAKTTADTDFCSGNGVYSFLSTVLLVFTKDPYSCIPLFSESESKCIYTLGLLLGTDCLHLFAEGSPRIFEVNLSHHSLSMLSCQLLCFPFALDLPSKTMSTILQLYDSCNIVTSLIQVIQTHPPPLLELPLSLLSRLLLCDPECSVSRLRNAGYGFLVPPRNSQITVSEHQTPLTRTANSLLLDLLQLDMSWDSAVELLTLLSQVGRCSACHAWLHLCLEASVLHQVLNHSYDRVRAATCRLLATLDPFRPPNMQPEIFKIMIDCLRDSCLPVRRMACRAVGNWLGYVATGARFKRGRSNGQGSDFAKNKCSLTETLGDWATEVEQGVANEESSRWLEEARRTVAMLVPLITDPDAHTRRHCCAALGNLVNVDGAVSLLLEKNATGLLLRVACTDSHNAVRQAAIATLCLYSQQDAIRQVLISIHASEKLLQASQHATTKCDYGHLIERLFPDT
ncbi:serine/threonine-protein kinase 36 isoform X2 [Channa argus]|uniref:serine/threonine-protein kinase 36 isoform X2 n=1 Tax=Channa argus TaxID=215402 RepID=UPI003521A7B5